MKIYRSIKTNRLTQKFGTYGEWYRANGINVKGHTGWDWATEHGEKLYFDVDIKGIVLQQHIDHRGGLGLDILTDDGELFKHRYWHLKSFNVKAGDTVETGDLIGWCDNTGFSTGDHLHRGLKPQTKDANGNYYNTEQNNGYFGAIDIAPYWAGNIFVKNLMTNLTAQVSILSKIVELLKQFMKKVGK